MERAKTARTRIPRTTRTSGAGELFFVVAPDETDDDAFVAEGAGVLVTEFVVREGTGGIWIFAASTFVAAETFLVAGRLVAGRFAAAFFAGRFVLFLVALFFAGLIFLVGRFAAAFFTGRLAEAFFLAATIDSLHRALEGTLCPYYCGKPYLQRPRE